MTLKVCRINASCGIREVYSIPSWEYGTVDGPAKFVKDFYNGCDDPEYHRRFRFALFSHNHHSFHMCSSIVKFIEDNGFGTVTVTSEGVNINYLNKIKVYLWEIDWKNLVEWITKNSPPAQPGTWVRTQTIGVV